MQRFQRALLAALAGGCLWFSVTTAGAADVSGYSILKGQFLNQTGPATLVTDPDFGFSFLASVDLTDFNLVTNATLRLPNGIVVVMDDFGDAWNWLDSFSTLSRLNSNYPWGNYTVNFDTVNDGIFSCVLGLPNTPLPPTLRLSNFDEAQAVNSAKPLTLSWDFSGTPIPGDFVQVYVNLGHDEVFSTPNLGEPGALNSTSRSVTIPADTFAPGLIYSLNLEITRPVSTNAACYSGGTGVTATFSSTSIDLITVVPPQLRLLSRPTNGVISLEVRAEAGKTVVLQGSDDLTAWSNLATNAAVSGTNLFTVSMETRAARIFRAWQK